MSKRASLSCCDIDPEAVTKEGMKSTQLRRIALVRAQAANGTARQIRTQAGISLREAALVIRTAPSTLQRWETGECSPRRDHALAWAELLDELVEGQEAVA